ncbi:MAG: histidine--tRNA ligase [Ruminococcaceae bacterium]|nr:histidine--tRNA ligase [Oscillospiraceae bacterium]
MLTKAPRGTSDILSPNTAKWQYLESKARDICARFGYGEIRTPTFEHTELFLRGVGDTTDVVEKQMYTFTDKGDRSITLRPEGTASAARAFIEHNLGANPLPVKLFYTIPCFRYEKPQAGRLREFHQFGVEVFGSDKPSVDVEIISLAIMYLNELGLNDLTLNINSIGCPECRKKYNEKLIEYFKEHYDELCDTCKSRLERNPLRILDCKSPICGALAKNAPKLIDYICDECSEHFNSVKSGLDAIGISYTVDPDIVRGLDYYTKTVFEVSSNDIGSQSAVCGGGRYDGLISELGGNATPGIGFALGIERLIMVMENKGLSFGEVKAPQLFVATIGKKADIYAEKLVYELRKSGIVCEKDRMGRSLKAQMKYADKSGYLYTVVLGDDEIDKNEATLKNMSDGTTTDVTLDKIADYLR